MTDRPARAWTPEVQAQPQPVVEEEPLAFEVSVHNMLDVPLSVTVAAASKVRP